MPGRSFQTRPGIRSTSTKKRTAREAPLQQAAVKYLRQRKRYVGDVQFCHVANEVRQGGGKDMAVRNEIARKKAEGLTPGAPDLIVWLDVRKTPEPFVYAPILCIEIKYGSTAQSESQREFEAGLNCLGHEYVLLRAKDPAEAAAKIHELIEAFQPMNTIPFGMLSWVEEDDPRIGRGPGGGVKLAPDEKLQATQDRAAGGRLQATQD